MSPIEFRAPWSKTPSTATLFSVALLGAVMLGAIVFHARMSWLALLVLIVMPLLVLATTAPFMVRGYVLTPQEILVKRAGWITHLPLAELQSVAGDNEAMRGSIRLLGNGGLFAFTGYFWNRRLGRYRAL